MNEYHKEKKFLDLPEYPGGKKAFQEFIRKNLRYPKEALEHKIEGTVYVKYRVDGRGRVISTEVTHGLGYGCDEEALRLVGLLRYGRAKNRRLRITASMNTSIHFILPKKKEIQYSYSKSKKAGKTDENQQKGESTGYGYTISF